MKNWINRNYRGIIISAFLIPIITVAIVSISHVTIWYGISNPLTWAVYLSIGIEIAALSALAAISADMGKKVYFPFGIVTLVQFIGNIYFSYQYIDINGETFKQWVELVSPLLEYIGVEGTDFVGHKRFLSLFSGGMLPIISLSFLHMLVKFTQENKFSVNQNSSDNIPEIEAKDLASEISRARLSEEDFETLEKILNNPPKPNENLKRATKYYSEKIKNSGHVADNLTSANESPDIADEKELDDEFNMYNDYVKFINNDDKLDNKIKNDEITPSTELPEAVPPTEELDSKPNEEIIQNIQETTPVVEEEKKKNQ